MKCEVLKVAMRHTIENASEKIFACKMTEQFMYRELILRTVC